MSTEMNFMYDFLKSYRCKLTKKCTKHTCWMVKLYVFFLDISLEKRAVFPGPSDFLHSSSKSLVSLPIILPIKSQFWAYSQELVSKPTPCPWQRGGKKVTPSAHPKGPKTEFEYTPCWRVGAGGKKGEEMLESQDRVVLGHGQSPLLFIPGLWCHVC